VIIGSHSSSVPVSDQPLLLVSVDWPKAVVHVSGELDFTTVPLVCEAADLVMPRVTSRLIIDVPNLTFIDGAGLQAFDSIDAALAGSGRQLVLTRIPPCFRRRIERFGSDGLVTAGLRGMSVAAQRWIRT